MRIASLASEGKVSAICEQGTQAEPNDWLVICNECVVLQGAVTMVESSPFCVDGFY